MRLLMSSDFIPGMVAIGGIADIVQHWHEMARSGMTQSEHERLRIAAAQTDP